MTFLLHDSIHFPSYSLQSGTKPNSQTHWKLGQSVPYPPGEKGLISEGDSPLPPPTGGRLLVFAWSGLLSDPD